MKMKRGAFLLVSIFLLSGVLSAFAGDDDDDHHHHDKDSKSRVQIGFDISPVPMTFDTADEEKEKKRKKQKAMAGLGSYMVNAVAGCANCHSCPTYTPGHNPFEGGDGELNAAYYLAGGTPFHVGDEVEVSPNITPNHDGLPAGMTEEEFVHAMRTGEHADAHGHAAAMDTTDEEHGVMEIMPWPMFRHMTEKDLKAIYRYLKSIPHAHTPAEGSCSGPGQ
jgi:hypothetical protein